MPDRRTATIYVDKLSYAVDRPFDYLVPEELCETLRRGCRVLVPFGTSNHKVQGLVLSVNCNGAGRNASSFDKKLKPISAQLDREPVISEEIFRVLEYLVLTTFCTWYEAVRAVLPAGTNVDIVEYYSLCRRPDDEELGRLSPAEQRLVEFCAVARTAQELNRFLDCRQNPSKSAAVKALVQRGIIEKSDRLKPRVAPHTVRMVRLSEQFDFDAVRLPQKQKEIVEFLRDVGAAAPKELAYLCGVTESVVRALVKKGALLSYEREVEAGYHPSKAAGTVRSPSEIQLSASQQKVCDGVWELCQSGKAQTALLHGVTGSGKTQVYIRLIDRLLSEGKTALMLVPEIALTPQLVDKFERLFGSVVAVVHSNLTVVERLEEYRRIQAGKASIVIGTRSAVFVPLQNIGAIILDEEGEASYKSESSPRYHARDVARFRCSFWNATLLLGSATPSIDSYYRAQKGDYSFFALEERYADANLPQVFLVDMREEKLQQSLSPLSGLLSEQLIRNLETGEQSILLINRRGYNTYASCMQCGEVLKCPDCSVAMTYHRVNGSLMCHYCGHIEPFTSHCPSCGGDYIKLTGTGTQRVEDEAARLFPQARLLRMDADTTGSRDAYEKNFEAFRRGDYDILLGTQMIAKGLDFPNVTLVGVINADGGLYSGDYKSGERAFSLVTQVVGRSGRSAKPGRAYIQTFDPEHPILNYAARQDYAAFYRDEIESRKVMLLPPFCDILVLGVSCAAENSAEQAAKRLLAILREESAGRPGVALKALGAAQAPVYKIAGKYRWRIIVKCRMNAPMRELVSNVLKRCGKDSDFSRVSLYADVNGEMN